jgi:hypothetical protein
MSPWLRGISRLVVVGVLLVLPVLAVSESAMVPWLVLLYQMATLESLRDWQHLRPWLD